MARRRSWTSLILRQIAFLLVLAALAGLALVATGAVTLPYRYDPLARIDLDAPPDLFTGFRLARAQSDPRQCFAALDGAGIAHRRVPDRAGPEGCGLAAAIETAPGSTTLAGRVTTACGLAASWILFERHVVGPAARAHLGQKVREVEHLGSYACRRIGASGTRWSQHATANAIDISGFVLEDGRRITLARDWSGTGRETAFLQALREGACRYFSVVLGPDYNAAHADHFHLDNGPARLCR